MASNPKLSHIDLSRLLTPAATLRPRAAQRCVTKQARLAPGLDRATGDASAPPFCTAVHRFSYGCPCMLWPCLPVSALDQSTPTFPFPQDHGLQSGLDVHLIPHCRPALVAKGEEPEPV